VPDEWMGYVVPLSRVTGVEVESGISFVYLEAGMKEVIFCNCEIELLHFFLKSLIYRIK
jgi:hypothetical protein